MCERMKLLIFFKVLLTVIPTVETGACLFYRIMFCWMYEAEQKKTNYLMNG